MLLVPVLLVMIQSAVIATVKDACNTKMRK